MPLLAPCEIFRVTRKMPCRGNLRDAGWSVLESRSDMLSCACGDGLVITGSPFGCPEIIGNVLVSYCTATDVAHGPHWHSSILAWLGVRPPPVHLELTGRLEVPTCSSSPRACEGSSTVGGLHQVPPSNGTCTALEGGAGGGSTIGSKQRRNRSPASRLRV